MRFTFHWFTQYDPLDPVQGLVSDSLTHDANEQLSEAWDLEAEDEPLLDAGSRHRPGIRLPGAPRHLVSGVPSLQDLAARKIARLFDRVEERFLILPPSLRLGVLTYLARYRMYAALRRQLNNPSSLAELIAEPSEWNRRRLIGIVEAMLEHDPNALAPLVDSCCFLRTHQAPEISSGNMYLTTLPTSLDQERSSLNLNPNGLRTSIVLEAASSGEPSTGLITSSPSGDDDHVPSDDHDRATLVDWSCDVVALDQRENAAGIKTVLDIDATVEFAPALDRLDVEAAVAVAGLLADLWMHHYAIRILKRVGKVTTVWKSLILKRLVLCQLAVYEFSECKATLAEYELMVQGSPEAVVALSMKSELLINLSQLEEAWALTQQVMSSSFAELGVDDVIDILHRTGRVSSACCQFDFAEKCAQACIDIAACNYGQSSYKYGIVLLSYGNLLLGKDRVNASVSTLLEVLQIFEEWFGSNSLLKAEVYERYAYALYVKHYNTREYDLALAISRQAVRIREAMLPDNHMLVFHARRVVALIIEELALFQHFNQDLMDEALSIHLGGLEVAKVVFGECSLVVSKYYGNLGRLYQARHEFDKSEEAHRIVISLKEQLHCNPFEVSSSLANLGALLTFDLCRHQEAEEILLRSTDIIVTHLGSSASGLLFNYRSLINVYRALRDFRKADLFRVRLKQWEDLQASKASEVPAQPSLSLDAMTAKTFSDLAKFKIES